MDYRTFISLVTLLVAGHETLMALQEWTHLSSRNQDLPAPGPATEQTACLILDVDRDGIQDFILASRLRGASVLWYRRVVNGWTQYVIEPETVNIEAGGAFHDLDNDGDLDLVFGADSRDNKIWWWENPCPNYDPNLPWLRREIKNSGANKHHDMIFGDFDGDGREEFVFWNQGANKLFFAEIPADPKATQPWPYLEIFTSPAQAEGLAKADLDGDGKLDLIGGGRWFRHDTSISFTAHVIDERARLTRAAVGQLKIGGWPEVVFSAGESQGPLKWYEWSGSAWIGQDLLSGEVDRAHTLEVQDVNQDGFLDIFCAEMRLNSGNANAKKWLFLGHGDGKFSTETIATGFGNHESKLGDLDGDGDLDILSKPFNWDTPRVDVWLNNGLGLLLDKWERHVIDAARPWRAIFISAADVDGDSLPDVVTGGWWYKNPGSPSAAWTRNDLGAPLHNMAAVYDFDFDGDFDVLGTTGRGSDPSDSLLWARNDSAGRFTVLRNVSKGDGDFLQGVAVARFQAGDPLEVALSWHMRGKGVQALTIPENPSHETWPWRQLSTASGDEALSAGDIDRDGDLDLLLGEQWLRNEGASWRAFTLYSTPNRPDRNRLVDINRDGRIDAVIGYEAISREGKLAWYEQDSIATSGWREHLIATIIGPMSLDVADMDGDGDFDVVVGEHNLASPASARLFVFENVDGRGMNWRSHLVHTGDEHHDGAQVVDIDLDGDLDILSIGWSHGRVLLYENQAIDFGNAPPAIVMQPQNATVLVGRLATFSVSATGAPPLRYQWHNNGIAILGATSATYTTPAVTSADSGAIFHCLVSNRNGATTSEAATLHVISFRGRVTQGQIALYTFEEGAGTLVHEASGLDSTLHLMVENERAVSWGPSHLAIDSTTIIATSAAAASINDSYLAKNAITLEAWIKPANATQCGPALIAALATDPSNFNIALGQSADAYEVHLRTMAAGSPVLTTLLTPVASATIELRHLVFTCDDSGRAKIYLDGSVQASMNVPGNFANWSSTHPLMLANDLTEMRAWLGEFHLLAFFQRALSAEEVWQNFVIGPLIEPDPAVPVELMSFSATVVDNSVILSWQTATETANAGFEVQRRQDNADFGRIGFVAGSGTTSTSTSYSFRDEGLPAGAYDYRLKQIDTDGSFEYSRIISVTAGLPSRFELHQNYPNPFNPNTTISFSLPRPGLVTLKIFNTGGKEVALLKSEEFTAGFHQAEWNASGLASGVYFYRLTVKAPDRGELFAETKKLVVIK